MELHYAKTNWYRVLFDHCDAPADYELHPVLAPLESAIEAAVKRIHRHDPDADPDTQMLIDDECGYIEDLLGAVFVVAQRYLTVVTSRVLRLNKMVHHDTGSPWSLPSKRPPLLSDYGPACPSASTVSFAAGVNAGANYFKHASEWGRPWVKAPKAAAATVATVLAMGAEEGSTGNCRTIAEALGVADYSDVDPIVLGLEAWKTDLLSKVGGELSGLKLI